MVMSSIFPWRDPRGRRSGRAPAYARATFCAGRASTSPVRESPRSERTMRRALLLLVALASTLAVARADDEEPSLPLNPFTEAKEGDWETLLFRVEVPGRGTITQLSTWRV